MHDQIPIELDDHDLYLDEVFDQALSPALCRTEGAPVCGR